MTKLFVSGMFRSGTTLFARALDSHRAIAMASDPAMELLKALRSEEAAQIGQAVPVEAPLSDYYFDSEGLRLHQRLQEETSLDRPFGIWERDRLLDVLRERCDAYSEKLSPRLERLQGASYREILGSLLEQVRQVYGNGETVVVGFKEVWATEFVPALARTYREARFVLVVRDPRAVCASKNVQHERYPWTFLTRQWRKLAALAWMYAHDPALGERTIVVRYEDVVRRPEPSFRRICDLLSIDWDPKLVDADTYRDGAGNAWRQNTSYGVGTVGFDAEAVERWRSVLSKDQIGFIEMMCAPEMRLFGYQRSTPEARPAGQLLVDPPRIRQEEEAQWMRPFVSADPLTTSLDVAHESIRDALLEMGASARATIDDAVVRGAFLDRRILEGIASSSVPSAKSC